METEYHFATVTLGFMALLLVGILTCLYLAWKLIPRLFRWMVADNDIHRSLRRTLVVVGCSAIVSLLVFLGRSEQPSAQKAPVASSNQTQTSPVGSAKVVVKSPGTSPKPPAKADIHQVEKNRALAAITSATDVRAIGPTYNMLVMPYGPCGILTPLGKVWIWSGEPSSADPPDGYLNIDGEPTPAYYTKEEAVAAAFDGCELQYKRMKAERDFAQHALGSGTTHRP